MNARKIMKSKKAAKAVAPKKKPQAIKPSPKRAASKASFDSDDEPTTSKRPKPPKAATTSAGKAKAARTSAGKSKAASSTSAGKSKAATTSPGKSKAAKTSPGRTKTAPASAAKSTPQARGRKAESEAQAVEAPKRKARGAIPTEAEPAHERVLDTEEIDIAHPRDAEDEAELEANTEAAAGTISEDDDALDEAEDEADSSRRAERGEPLVSDISEILSPRGEDEDPDAQLGRAALELSDDMSADSQPAPTTRAHLKRIVESLIFVADQAVSANQLGRLVKAKAAEVREVVTEIMRDYDGRGVELVEVGGGFQFRSAAASAPFVRDLVSARPVRLTRAQLETLALIAYRQPITRPEIDDVRGVDSGSAIKVLLDRDLVKILGRKDEAGRPLLYGTAPQFLDFFGMKGLQDLPTLREFTELSEENRELFAKKMGEVPADLSDPSIGPVVQVHDYDEEGNLIVVDPNAAAAVATEDSEPNPDDESTEAISEGEVAESVPDADSETEPRGNGSDDDERDERELDDDDEGADDDEDEDESDEDPDDEAVAKESDDEDDDKVSESDDEDDDDGDEDELDDKASEDEDDKLVAEESEADEVEPDDEDESDEDASDDDEDEDADDEDDEDESDEDDEKDADESDDEDSDADSDEDEDEDADKGEEPAS
jgi:segregation and condensation protein B